MSEAFKGKSGGDPSRKPPVITITYQCQYCAAECSAETRKPDSFVIPDTCSNECSAALVREQAKTLIRLILGEEDIPEEGSIPQRIAEELLQAHRWLGKAELGEVKIVSIICAHCENPADKFSFKTATEKNGPSPYCSFACRESKASKLPKGVVCRSPRKETHPTAEEARKVAEKLRNKLLLEGDKEGVEPYSCTCGQWHTGHLSKREWLEAATHAVTLLNEKTTVLIQNQS